MNPLTRLSPNNNASNRKAINHKARAGFAMTAVLTVCSLGAAACQAPPSTSSTTTTAPTNESITLVDTRVIEVSNKQWRAEFYRNNDLDCGESGKFTFAVIDPVNDPDAEAPLWIFLHGGGTGYFTDEPEPEYVGPSGMNDEEGFEELLSSAIGGRNDTLINRRLLTGWRVLVPSMCDHDLRSGNGAPYPNNPHHGAVGDTVDGLTADLAAVAWVSENRESTWAVIHGTSAGSVGAFSLTYTLHQQGIDVNATILDAYLVTPRLLPLMEAGITPQEIKFDGFEYSAVVDKVGQFADVGPDGMFPERAIAEEDFRAVPMLDVIGDADPHCAGQFAPVPEAEGQNNCVYVHQGFAEAVAAQEDSPHGSIVVEGGGHSTTKRPGQITDDVEAWLSGILSNNSPEPFG